MVEYRIKFTRQALKDLELVKASSLNNKAKNLINIIKQNPYQTPPPYEKLIGDLNGLYSRRINIQHRLVYEVIEKEKAIKIIRMWKHYE